MFGANLGRQRLHGRPVGYIQLMELGSGPGKPTQFGGVLRGISRQVGGDDVCATLGKSLADGTPDARAGSGDHHHGCRATTGGLGSRLDGGNVFAHPSGYLAWS